MPTKSKVIHQKKEEVKTPKKLSYEVVADGKVVAKLGDYEALLIVGYRPGKKHGDHHGFALEPNVIGDGLGLFHILEKNGYWKAEVAVGLGMEKQLTVAKLMNVSGALGDMLHKAKSSKKKPSTKKKAPKK